MKRASVKGLGEDIFFAGPSGGTSPTQVPTSVPPEALGPRRTDVEISGYPDVPTSARPDVPASDAAEKEFFSSPALPSTLRRRLRALLRDERRIHTTVRFSAEEMAALRDLVYQLEARMGIKITRNEVMRIALRFLLEDYELRKKGSLLLQVLEEDQG